MKKISLLLVILLIHSNFLNSQNEPAFILEDENGIVIENNQLLEVITTEYPNASFNFFVRNLTSENINVRAEIIEMAGTDGSMMEFCFGECYYGVTLNTAYPLGSFISVESGQVQTSVGDHFYNQDVGDGENPVFYSFRFFMVDNEGNEVVSVPELDTEYFVSYQYQAQSFGISDLLLDKIELFKSERNLVISSEENMYLTINDMSGKKIIDINLTNGDNLVDLSSYANEIIILNFETKDNSKFSKKILFN
tara:strand:- start:162 stop:914 length:753 start_codon:yes stop_codon:yes gene_type:complete